MQGDAVGSRSQGLVSTETPLRTAAEEEQWSQEVVIRRSNSTNSRERAADAALAAFTGPIQQQQAVMHKPGEGMQECRQQRNHQQGSARIGQPMSYIEGARGQAQSSAASQHVPAHACSPLRQGSRALQECRVRQWVVHQHRKLFRVGHDPQDLSVVSQWLRKMKLAAALGQWGYVGLEWSSFSMWRGMLCCCVCSAFGSH